jgi:hypothetical protein
MKMHLLFHHRSVLVLVRRSYAMQQRNLPYRTSSRGIGRVTSKDWIQGVSCKVRLLRSWSLARPMDLDLPGLALHDCQERLARGEV